MLVNATLLRQDKLCDGVYRMVLGGSFPAVKPGQFANVFLNRVDMPLPRPFGIVSATDKVLTLCYQVVGKGTEYLSHLPNGATVTVNAGLGNGFPTESFKKIALVGGGVGIFPLHSVPLAHPDCIYRSYLGYRDKEHAVLLDEFACFGNLFVGTDDGSLGKKDNAVNMFLADYEDFRPDAVLSCGPLPMFRALQKAVEERGIDIPVFISMEERMGCGIGACLVCTCKTKNGRKRVCKDGPVFPIDEVVL